MRTPKQIPSDEGNRNSYGMRAREIFTVRYEPSNSLKILARGSGRTQATRERSIKA